MVEEIAKSRQRQKPTLTTPKKGLDFDYSVAKFDFSLGVEKLCLVSRIGIELATTCLEARLNGFQSLSFSFKLEPEADASLGRRSLPVPPLDIIILTPKGLQVV